MTRILFPLWQIDLHEYRAVCAHLGITPKTHLYGRLSEYLVNAPFRFSRPTGFSLFLAKLRLTHFRIARLDLTTKLFFSDHPIRHVLNAVIALHECDGEGYREMAASPIDWTARLVMLGWALAFGARVALTLPWLGWQLLLYAAGMPFRPKVELAGQRILVTGVNRGLGMDLMLHCLEQGGEVVGTVKNRQSLDDLMAQLPAEAPVTLVIADLSKPGCLVEAIREARIPADSLRMAILCAGIKHEGGSVLSLSGLRDTFQVNCFSAAEFAAWLCAPHIGITATLSSNEAEQRTGPSSPQSSVEFGGDRKRSTESALVLISSMGRWHGMHFACGYNASKAALSIWGESLDMELRQSASRKLSVTIVEPGLFESGMARQRPLTKFLFASRRDVACDIVAGGLSGRRAIRPPFWFALLTWAVCLAGRDFRYWLFARAKSGGDR